MDKEGDEAYGLNTWSGVNAPQPSPNHVGLKSYEIIYPKGKIEKVVEKLKTLSAPVEIEGHTYVTEDPSGNRIILTEEN